ncbi:MAG: hypothetical protein JO261_00630 [Alphaproteobacteria bacterium]|nr:hypothetical protein [Alphaproteobacteria bacterium]MBV9692180.1 hypothetical protein [Alphaproteobacteria bacterium]
MQFKTTAGAAFALSLIAFGAWPARAGYSAAGAVALGIQIAERRHREEACEAGRAPDPDQAADVDKRSQARLEQYFERVITDDHGSVTHLFIDQGKRARWTGPNGPQPVTAIDDPYAKARGSAALVRKAFVVGGDNESARGIWSITVPDPKDPTKTQTLEYGVDFVLGGFGGMWILHMHVYAAPDSAPLPEKFCHIVAGKSY